MHAFTGGCGRTNAKTHGNAGTRRGPQDSLWHAHASEEHRAIAACGHAEGAQDRAERDPRELRNFHEFDMLELATLAVTKFASSSLPAPLATSSSLPPLFFSP